MESSARTGDKSTLDDEEGLKVGMGSIAKRPCTVLLEEKIEENFQPTEEELLEYALWLGMNIPRDMDLIWIARDGLTQPLPEEWKPCQTEDDEVYYFNFETGESVWDHPCDGLYRKLYQEECKKLGKRPYQMRENLSSSSNLQQKLSNWGEASTYLQAPHQMNYDAMLNEKENHSPRGPPQQDDLGLERLPSNKEIQMTIVETEINSLKGIRDQLLQKMNEVWQGEQFPSLASQLVVERVANFGETVEQTNASLLEGRNDQIPSLEVEHFAELNTQLQGQHWNKVQLDEEEDPKKTKERTEILRKQLEMAKMIPPQLANRVGGDIHDCRQMYEDHHRWENQISRGSPINYASKVSQEANGKHSFVSEGRDALHRVREQLKKEELVIVDEMKERILMQVRKSMEIFEKNACEEYELLLTRKKENLELLRKELRKDMEFELLLEEELILKRKRGELLTRIHNQVGRESSVAWEGSKTNTSTQLANGIENRLVLPKDEKLLEPLRIGTSIDSICSNHEALTTTIPVAPVDYNDFSTKTRQIQPKGKEALYHKSVCDDPIYRDNKIVDTHGVSSQEGPRQKLDVDTDLKELFLLGRRELRDDLVSLNSKMNEILVSHAKANQLNLETSSILTVPTEDNYKALNNAMPIVANPTQLLYTLQRSIGELDASLKHLLEERKVGLDSENNAHVKDQQSKPSTQNNEKVNLHHLGDISTDVISILKEFLVVMGEELEKNISHHNEDVTKIEKSKHIVPYKGDESLDMKTNDKMSTETSLRLKSLIEKIEKHLERQTAQQEERSKDKAPGFGPNMIEILIPKYGVEPQSVSLNEEICMKVCEVRSIVTQFKAISIDMISTLKGFICQLDGETKERTQQCGREVKREVNGSRRHNESTRHGHGIVKDHSQIPPYDFDYHINNTSKETSGESISFGKLSADALGMLELFVDKLYYELKDHISSRDIKASKDINRVQMDSKLDTNVQLHKTSLQEIQGKSSGDIYGTSTILDISCNGLDAKTLCNSKGFDEGLHQGITPSIQHKSKTAEDNNSNFPPATDYNNVLQLCLDTNPEVQSVCPKMEGEKIQQAHILELDKLPTKSLYALDEFQNDIDKDLHDQVLRGTGEPELDAMKFKLGKLGDNCASSPKGTSFDTCSKSTSQDKVKTTLDAHFTTYNIMRVGLEKFIAEVDEELKAITRNCKRKLKNESDRMRSAEMKDIEHHEFYSQTEETELESKSFLPLLKAWSTEIEKSTQNLLQHFKSEFMEEMNMLQQKKANKHSTLNCDELQTQEPQHLTHVQTLMAEEKCVWYDILNDATKQWLQKEWVERIEHQSDLTTTCDNSISPPNSEPLTQVQKVLGEEKKIIQYDILNHSPQKWLVHQGNPLESHDRTSKIKESVRDTTEPLKGGFGDDYSQCRTKSQQCYTSNDPCAGNGFERNQVKGRRHITDVVDLEEERQSNLFANELEVMGRLPDNLDFCMVQSSCSGKEKGNKHGCEVEQNVKLIHDVPLSGNNLSSINSWISKAKLFGAFNPVNKVRGFREGDLCEECQKQNILIHGVKREARGHHGRLHCQVPRTISQLKLVSKRSWRTLQSKLRVSEATRWAHVIGSWASEQMSCGLLLKKDCSYPFVMKKSIKVIMEKTTCGKANDSANSEDFEDEQGRDYNKGSVSDGQRDNIIQKYHGCYPSIKPYLTRSTNFKNESANNSVSPVDLEGFHDQNSSVAYGEVKGDYLGRRAEIPLNNPVRSQSAESIENSFVNYQSDDDLALSNAENTQCDCQTHTPSSINLREVDMYEESINNLRKREELEAKGKLLWVNHSHTDCDHLQDEHTDSHVKPTPTYQIEFDTIKPFDFAHGDKDVNSKIIK